MKIVESFGRALFKPLFPYLRTSPEDELRNSKYHLLYNYSHQLYDEEVQRFKDLEDKSSKLLTALSIISLLYFPVVQWVSSLIGNYDFILTLFISVVILDLAFFFRAWLSLKKAFTITEVPKMPLNSNILEHFKNDEIHVNTLYHHLYQGYNQAIETYKVINGQKSKSIEDGYNNLDLGFKGFIVILTFAVIHFFLSTL
jgi:hypothetical protein